MQQRKILLLENVASQAAGVREQLTRAGHQVAVSRYESDGLKRLAEWHPDLVLVSTAHPAGDFVEYCRRARPLAPSARFVVTSSLKPERLFQEHAGLQELVDGVLLRPFSPEEAAALLPSGPAPAPRQPAATGRLVVVLDRDAALAQILRRGLEPHGVQLAAVPFERIGAFCDAHRPAVVILEWPVPPEFIAGPLARIRSGTGAPVAVLLLADSSQESVSRNAPALLQTVDMFFRKPVAWEPFFRVLARHLGVPEIAAFSPEAALPEPPPAPVPASAPSPAAEAEALRAEFQRQLEAKFLEVEELKRRLDVASRQGAAAPGGLEWLQSENEHLRQGIKEAEKKASLALAAELLKRSEIEVKLDNLLRMKEDFEFRAQNELDERTQRIEALQAELRERDAQAALAERAAAECAAMRAELERALVAKERLEEQLHSPEAASPAAAVQRLAELEQEAARLRAESAEARTALADASVQAAVLEESLARERAGREALVRELESERAGAAAARRESAQERDQALAQLEPLREELLRERERAAGLETRFEQLRQRVDASEGALAQAQAGHDAAVARAAELARTLAEERETRAAAAGQERERETAELQGLARDRDQALSRFESARGELAAAQARGGELQARLDELEQRLRASESAAAAAATTVAAAAARESALADEASASAQRLQESVAERERLRREIQERESGLAAEVRSWREQAEAAALELELLRGQAAERDGRAQEQLRGLQARVDAAEAARREADAQRAALELAVQTEREASRAREGQTREQRAALERALQAEQDAARARDEDAGVRLAAQQALTRELEERLAERPAPSADAGPPPELRRIQELLEEVISRAREDAVGNARREAELSVRLQDLIEERRQLQERFDRAATEAAERERRSASLLQSAIDRGPAAPSGRDNLPAVLPAEPSPRAARSGAVVAGIALTVVAAALLFASLRRGEPPPAGAPPAALPSPGARQPAPAPAPPTTGTPQPAAIAAAQNAEGAARELWDRWTRSDSSGGVLVQATLRSEQEVGAEVEAERRNRGWSPEQTRAELARRLSVFRFGSAWYATVYLKNLSPGYPAYFADLESRFRLRDSSGREVPAFLPPGQESGRRVFTFGAGEPSGRVYEATLPLGFSRTGLSASPTYLQLVVSDVGTASRRVLTWELE